MRQALLLDNKVEFLARGGCDTRLPSDFRNIVAKTQRDLGAVMSRVELIKQGDEVVPGMRVVETPGHTPG